MIDTRSHRKFVAGLAGQFFFWQESDGYHIAVDDDVPRLTFRGETYDMSRACEPVSITGISGTVLTADDEGDNLSGSWRGNIGDRARAWLDCGSRGQFPVTILRFTGPSTIEIAEPLPHAVALDSGEGAIEPTEDLPFTLYIAQWVYQLTDDDVALASGETRETSEWSVSWRRGPGQQAAVIDAGFAVLCRRPFSTGCTDLDLLYHIPGFARQIPPGQTSWLPQVRLAEDELVDWLGRVVEDGYTEDDVQGSRFRKVQARLAAAIALEGQAALNYPTAAEAERQRTLAKEAFDRITEKLDWLDRDRDGVVEAGETGVSLTGITNASSSSVTDSSWSQTKADRWRVNEWDPR